ncbi:TPA: hypothetical protein ENS27_01170, partial [bacterium]|nr:hypothetical protein [bacterium]
MKIVIFLLVFTVVAFTPSVWAVGGPIIAFNFDSAKNGVVEDVTGGGHNGVLKEGATIVTTKKFGAGALKIDGGNQTMEVATFAKLETYTDNTYAFWINFTAPASGGWDQILVHPAAPDSDRSPGLWVTPEGLSIHYRYNPGNLGFWGITQTGDQDAKFFEQNVWYHIVGVTSKALLTGFVNGKKVAEKAVPEKFAQGAREGM